MKLFGLLKSLIVSSALLFSAASSANTLVLDDNTVYLRDEVNNSSISVVMHKLGSVLSKGDTAYLYITSPGGSVVAGNNLVTFIEAMQAQGKKIICIADIAASMAFVITQSCSERLVKQDSIVMQHQASFALEGQTENNISMMNLLLDMLNYTDLKQAKRIGLTLEEFKKKIAHDWWLFGVNAVKENVADKLVSPVCSQSLLSKTVVEKRCSLFFGCYKATYSECPIIRGYINIEVDEKMLGDDKFLKYLKATNPSSTDDIKLYLKEFNIK